MDDYEKYTYQRAVSALRINVKSLAAESRFNRFERKRCPAVDGALRCHLLLRLRPESRVAQLALAAVRGNVPYERIERNAKSEPDWVRIMKKVPQPSRALEKKVRDWIDVAKKYREAVTSRL